MGTTYAGSNAWVEALVAATVYRDECRAREDEAWRAAFGTKVTGLKR